MLHYTTAGAPDHPPVLFLHGFMGRAGDWRPIIEAVQEVAYCIAVDLPGHGASVGLPGVAYTMAGTARRLAEVLRAESVARCAVVGYSMGGRTALQFALRHPARCSRLLLESASPGLRSKAARAARRHADRERAVQIATDFEAFLHDWYRMPLFASLRRHGLVDAMVRQRQANRPDELAKSLHGMGTGAQSSCWERIPTQRIFTLALTGALDDKYVRITSQMAALHPRLRTVIVPEAGHNVHAERPDAFIHHLRRFVDGFPANHF